MYYVIEENIVQHRVSWVFLTNRPSHPTAPIKVIERSALISPLQRFGLFGC